MSGSDLGFVHRHEPATDPSAPPLLLLHGTGGTEDDLIGLGAALSPGGALLSPRGKVLENGMPRFFRRLAEGVFDHEDLLARTHELAGFVEEATARYGIGMPLTAVGFSNGANVAASLLLLHPGLLRAAVLLRPMVPFEPQPLPDLAGTAVLVAGGLRDPIVPQANTEALADLLRASGAEVELVWADTGHGLTQGDVDAARRLVARLGPAT